MPLCTALFPFKVPCMLSSAQPCWCASCLQLMHWFEQPMGGCSTPVMTRSTSIASSLRASACGYPFREQSSTRLKVFQSRQDILSTHKALVSSGHIGQSNVAGLFFFFQLHFQARSIRQVMLFLIARIKNPFSGDGVFLC